MILSMSVMLLSLMFLLSNISKNLTEGLFSLVVSFGGEKLLNCLQMSSIHKVILFYFKKQRKVKEKTACLIQQLLVRFLR